MLSSTDPNILQESYFPVARSNSSLESVEVFSPAQNQNQSSNIMAQQQLNMGEASRNLHKLRNRLTRAMEISLTTDLVTLQRVPVIEEELASIKVMRDDYQDAIEDYLLDFSSELEQDPAEAERFRQDITTAGRKVEHHANEIRAKKESLCPTPQLSQMDRSTLEYYQSNMEFQQLNLKEKQQAAAVQERDKSEESRILAETESNTFLGECSVLGDLMIDETWEAVDDETVSSAMRNLSRWQDQMTIIERAYRKYENMALKHNFPEDKQDAITLSYQEKKDKFEQTREAVQREDTARGLFTLEPVKSDIIKYPTFSGLASEDYLKFKEIMVQRFRENKVKRKEQVAKLRECLKGAALGRVPEGVKDIEEAFNRLNEAFGNPSKVMAFNLKALDDLGMMPSDKLASGQLSYSRRIEWLLKLEVILGKILELSQRSSKLAHEAFSSSTYRRLWSRFPSQVLDKLVKIQGEDGERFKAILDKLKKMREHAQIMDDECGHVGAAAAIKKRGDGQGHTPSKVTAEIFFRPPQQYDECRICLHLSVTKKGQQNLFQNHLSNYPTGCPKFIEATMELRKTLVESVKFCPQCFNPELVFSPPHLQDCQFSISGKKNAYICTKSSCRTHMWICLLHKRDNKEQMAKFRADLQKRGHNLAFTSIENFAGFHTDPHAYTEAVRRMRRSEKKKKPQNRAEIVPVPDGEPLFLFHPAQGRTRPVNTFYDSGCSHAVFQADIPITEFKGQLTAKGPFCIGGVGGLTTSALDEWVVMVPRTDGRKQLIQGLTVPRVTCDFPLISLGAAVQEVKAGDPDNQELQRCRVPPEAGGAVDMLLGIKYSSIFPEPVHSLPCGLTIYRSQLASHDGFDCCIGGPHKSFQVLTGMAGGAARLLSHFVDGLKVYREWGPPMISSIAMTNEEVQQAIQFNTAEGDMEEFIKLRDLEELDSEMVDSEVEDDSDKEFDQPWKGSETRSTHDDFVCCQHCTEPSSRAIVSSDERIRDLKKFYELHESGLEVEYRCPVCRDCMDCKNSDKTEKISLREECEMFEIRKSVVLDLENKRIQCSLPLIGEESDFLSCNRERALKILVQQCRKYYKDEDTKETILKAFAKLFDNGHAKFVSDLTPEECKFLEKQIQYHIPWRVVFSGSPTTPCRPVLDASSRTSFRKDKTGGKSLNDLVAKGKVETLNLVKVLIRFCIGKFALTGDLKQFYNACKLGADQWNLQRFLWIDDLDPEGKVLEAVITTLIYGVRSVAAQSELALSDLAQLIKKENPQLAVFLILSRYVDDLQDSKATLEECTGLAKDADELFLKVGLVCKAWTLSGSPPTEVVTKDGVTIGVGGFGWFPEGDVVELKVPKLHFGKSRRGRLPDTVRLFDGDENDLDDFVPQDLSRRQAASKLASLWDILGKLAPIMTGLKLDLRETFQRTAGWDDEMPPDLRQKWVKNFWLMERLRGLKYKRAVMPVDAIDSKLRLLTGVDAAKQGLMMGCWGGFKKKDGSWSNKLILGRSLLAKSESIPKDELEALCAGSNMAWVVRSALHEWVDSNILFSDSTIALCWLTSEKLKLSLFHRNRVLQVRRGTNLEDVFHVGTEFNPADCGTRPDKVKLADIGPASRWENGDSWMTLEIKEAVNMGILKPATALRVSKDIDGDDIDDYKRGLMFGGRDEVTAGFPAHIKVGVSATRLKKLEERAKFSTYPVLPTKHSFQRTVRIYGYIVSFVRNARKGRKMLGEMLKEAELWFSVFNSDLSLSNYPMVQVNMGDMVDCQPKQTKVLQHFSLKQLAFQNTENWKKCILSNENLHTALLYLFRKASAEVKFFNSDAVIKKLTHEKFGILFSKGRILDGMNFLETSELGNLNLGSLGVKVNIPVLDRFSPLSYCIAQHVHWNVSKHRGIETTNRMSLEQVTIIQGMNLYREIAEECMICHMKRKQYLEVPMGPISQDQLVLAPPFYITMLDLFGPVEAYVPGFERHTRNRQVLESKMYIMVAVCVTTKIVNLQMLEGRKTHEIIDGFTRLSAEVGVPSMVHVDEESGAVAGFKIAELDFLDLQHQLQNQLGISFSTCPVSGHHQHGQVERVIRSIKETFQDHKLNQKRLHSMGWQTFCKLAENAYNNLPIGYSHSRYQDNTELLKILTPNMLRVGKLNSRALQGPIRLPATKKELLEHVEKLYSGWFKIFKDTVVPRLIQQPKWFKVDQHLKEKDLVYFQKSESALSSPWTVGEVDQVVVGRDGFIRRAIIKYFNASENDPEAARYHPQFTDRSVRKLVKLWSIDEACLFDDLAELQGKVDKVDETATVCDDDKVAGGDGVQSYISGYESAAGAVPVAGPGFLSSDGEQLDASIYMITTACDLSPVMIENRSDILTQKQEQEEDQDQERDSYSYKEVENMDTLYNLLVSTNLSLD